MSAPPLDRLPPIPQAQQSPAQQAAAAALIAGPRGQVAGPFVALLRSPELCDRTQRLGEYLRYGSVLAPHLRELAILATARFWRQNYEWHTHAPLAERAGVARTLIEALAADALPVDHLPEGLESDEAVVLRFCIELQQSHAVSDRVYGQARALLGEDGVVELCGICGYYTLLAMVLNVARTPLPPGVQPCFAP